MITLDTHVCHHNFYHVIVDTIVIKIEKVFQSEQGLLGLYDVSIDMIDQFFKIIVEKSQALGRSKLDF